MRILHVIRQYKPVIGGMENFVENLAVYLKEKGIESEVLTLNIDFSTGERFPESSIINGIRVKRIPFFGSRRYPIALSAINYLSNFDLIHIHGVDFLFDYLAGSKRFHKKPMILSTHGGFFHTKRYYLYKKIHFHTLTRLSLKNMNWIVAASEPDYELFKAISPARIGLIENGINFNHYHTIMKHNGEPNRFIFVGRFSQNKRIDKLLTLITRLKSDFPDIHLSIVGRDYDNLKGGFDNQIEKCKIGKHVTIYEASSDENLLKEMSRATYFISASEYEGFGLSSLEAMAAGRIAFLSQIPSFIKMVSDGNNGYLVNFEDMDSVVEKVKSVLKIGIQDQVRLAGAETAKKNSWDEIVNKFIQIYEMVQTEPTVSVSDVK
ncbi:hypothetical protein CYL18_09160 [Pradoshia eiseniae]|uniref:Glycosyl transferase family 1 n=1 Tax=Pradoshia eiseniae TaxID=2064768 RepID=A0A2S7N080_9BACI|nr:glycosyltransferase family 4 protein [Pradoshia eiseniae]PQD95444.1 hypothetical protein CYL18_09160 [Pradoshia eiseniae]